MEAELPSSCIWELRFIPRHGQISTLCSERKGRREEGRQERAVRETESGMCLPAWAILCATSLIGICQHNTVSSVGPSPTFELTSPSVSLGLKDMHFVFLSASQPLHLVLNQRSSDLFQCWQGNAGAKCTGSPTACSGAWAQCGPACVSARVIRLSLFSWPRSTVGPLRAPFVSASLLGGLRPRVRSLPAGAPRKRPIVYNCSPCALTCQQAVRFTLAFFFQSHVHLYVAV